MKKYRSQTYILLFLCLPVIFYGILFIRQRGIPFVTKSEQWTIGIIRGRTPFSYTNPLNLLNPLLKAEHVTDVPAKFVADPFLIKQGETWYLFFEVYNKNTAQGDLAVATSKNTWKWNYEHIILDEPFHLSYPYVFKWENNFYLIPESFEDNSVRLYKADPFPTHWTFVKTLIEGKDFVDNSIVYFNDKWWLFSATTSNDTLYLFMADNLTGPWTEHPMSPIVNGNKHIARPSGRLLVYGEQLYRYAMDVNPPSGTHQITALKIIEITPTSYAEEPVAENPILKANGHGWTEQAMHQIDPVQVEPDLWIASVDGFGKYYTFDLNH